MSGKQLLIKFDSNYADEFDVEGFTIMDESKWEEHKAKVTEFFRKRDERVKPDRWGNRDGVEVYFGTNEQMIYETLDCYLRSFTATEISDEEIATLKKLFGRGTDREVSFGMLCMLDNYAMEDEN